MRYEITLHLTQFPSKKYHQMIRIANTERKIGSKFLITNVNVISVGLDTVTAQIELTGNIEANPAINLYSITKARCLYLTNFKLRCMPLGFDDENESYESTTKLNYFLEYVERYQPAQIFAKLNSLSSKHQQLAETFEAENNFRKANYHHQQVNLMCDTASIMKEFVLNKLD